MDDKELEYIFIRVHKKIRELYKKVNVDSESSEFASYVLSIAFSLSLKTYLEASKSTGSDSVASLAIFNLLSRMFKDEFLDIILKQPNQGLG